MGTQLVFLDDDMRRFFHRLGLREMSDYFALEGAELVRQRENSTLRRQTLVEAGRQECMYLKSYDYSRLPVWRRLGAERAGREARNYCLMRDSGMDVPQLIAHGDRRRRGLLCDGLIITREIPGGIGLIDWFERQKVSSPASLSHQSVRRRLLADSAAMISRMHERGFYHIDLQWRNIMVVSTVGTSPRLVLLDSARGGQRKWPLAREYGKMRDLSSLYKDARRYLSRMEMIRWLRRYLGVGKIVPREKQLVWTILRDRDTKDNSSA